VSTTDLNAAASVQLRTIPISAIVPIEGWNPRLAFDDAELRALSASMLERGCLVPVRVQATGNGDYRLVDGEKRYKAAVLGSLMELPAIVRPLQEAADDSAVAEGELLVDAVVANQLRSQLSPVEEALACRRLKRDHGLTLKGIAQKLQMTHARVRERLAILELPEALWPRIGTGEIPLGAIGGLAALTKIHPGLAGVAVTLVLDREDVYDAEPWRWQDVASDPLSVVATGLHEETVDAPAGVFVSSQRYPLSTFALDDKHQATAAKLAELQGVTVDELGVRFDRDAIEQARKLGAAHTPEHGWVTLIVGQDVADTIAADQITATLKSARSEAKRQREASRSTSESAGRTGDARGAVADGGGESEAVDEEAQKERARAERQAAAAERERCAAFNDKLGVAIVNSLSRVKLDDRTVKILTAINVADELDRIAMRGARYGFPGWVTVEETKRGTKRRYIEQRSDAQAKAIEYLEGAKTAGEVAGRTLALLLMAVYAQEGAVAQSSRAFHTVSVQSALPWASEVSELIDELAGEKLPAALMDPVLTERRARHEQRRAAAVAKAEAKARIDELQPRLEDLTAQELDELERLADIAYGQYTMKAWQLRNSVRARRKTLADSDAADDAGEGQKDAPVDVEPVKGGDVPSAAGASDGVADRDEDEGS
jgi:ParB/RepB/Spo0J family partition protein